jgi:O-antigen ligase
LDDAWQIFKKQPVLGVGFGAYTYALHQTFPERTVWQLQPPHNIYMLIAVELGFVGLIFFVINLFFLLYKTWKNRLSFVLLFSLLILGMFDYWWISLMIGLYFYFFVFGFIYLLKRQS